MMAIVITWPGVILGVICTIAVEAIGLLIYAIREYTKPTKMIMEEIKDERK